MTAINTTTGRFQPLLAALLSGILLTAAWPVSPATLLIFFAFTPLLWLTDSNTPGKKYLASVYIAMLFWNIGTTWWIWNASPPGAVGAFLANSLLMCLPWWGYRKVKNRMGENFGYLSLVVFWLCFEFIHLQDWGLSWPWLTLGNVFATHTEWIQWYEWTGTSGGSFWVLLSNVLIYALFKEYQRNGRSRKYFVQLLSWLLILVIPALVYNRLHHSTETATNSGKNIVVVQPNIDPYEKISSGSFNKQLQILISNSESQIDSQTVLLIWPETALYTDNRLDEDHLAENPELVNLFSFLRQHPRLRLFTGIESFRQLDHATSYTDNFNGSFFESYNSSVVLDANGAHSFYHKSMLVPGVETLPWFLRFISKWFEKFGGTTAGYARQNERTVLDAGNGIQLAPSICYESVYGEYMSRYVKNGANLITIITNDGWWKNTPGHKQHMNYARLRAIENRTWVARSANTGISCFIDPTGAVIDPQPYNSASAIKIAAPVTNQPTTFFTRNGDIISRIACVVSIGFILIMFFKRYQRWRNKKSSGD